MCGINSPSMMMLSLAPWEAKAMCFHNEVKGVALRPKNDLTMIHIAR